MNVPSSPRQRTADAVHRLCVGLLVLRLTLAERARDREEGATLAEYGLVVAAVVVGTIAAAKVFNVNIRGTFTNQTPPTAQP